MKGCRLCWLRLIRFILTSIIPFFVALPHTSTIYRLATVPSLALYQPSSRFRRIRSISPSQEVRLSKDDDARSPPTSELEAMTLVLPALPWSKTPWFDEPMGMDFGVVCLLVWVGRGGILLSVSLD